MIRLIEEPVTYNTDYDAEDVLAWIYKNPTVKEVDELRDECHTVRICTCENNDYYVASSYYFIHEDIFRMTHTVHKFDLVVWFNKNVLSIYIRRNNLSDLKPVYDAMIQNGLINKDTLIIDAINGYNDDNPYSPKVKPDSYHIIDVSEITGESGTV